MIVLLFVAMEGMLSAQNNTGETMIALFGLSYTEQQGVEEYLNRTDETILSVFAGLDSVTVKETAYRLDMEDIDSLIEAIETAQSRDGETREGVSVGDITIDASTFDQLLTSSFIVVPVLTFFDILDSASRGYRSRGIITFTIIDVEKVETTAFFSIEATGRGEPREEAINSAIQGITPSLTERLETVSVLRKEIAIVDVIKPWEVVIGAGQGAEVRIGDEFTMSGDDAEQQGLLVVKRVEEDYAFANVVHSTREPRSGDTVEKLLRVGAETAGYTHLFLGEQKSLAIGIRQYIRRGFYSVRPLLGLEVPLQLGGNSVIPFGYPLNVYLGGELNWYLGRFQFVPMAAVGIGIAMYPPSGAVFGFTHAGFLVIQSINILLGNSVRLFVEGGYSYWFGLSALGNYGGPVIGLGVMVTF
jgi:hypothetical protein